MILNALAAAFALLSLNFSAVSTPAPAVESSYVSATMGTAVTMSGESEWTLITFHAAHHWNLTPATAWTMYQEGEIDITEFIPDRFYRIDYDGGYIEVVLEDNMG